ncbi:MAG TPA: toll/interleukin-1 receptor domain-containing protein [Anaerolineales bacterium]|nr:toll/interleukin-1 receptor domain-containing protein [Anaerolineales bacterium]
MANEEQLRILKRGVPAWNQWRKENNTIKVDLSGAVLSNLDLSGIDLRDARLTRVDFRDSNLQKARLSLANLSRAGLIGASLNQANLKETRLSHAIIMNSDVRDADLSSAYLHKTILAKSDLSGAYLYKAHLSEVYLTEAKFTNTVFADTTLGARDLSLAIELERSNHHGPSTIGLDTIHKSKGRIPERFLRGCGLSDADIQFAKLSDPDFSNEEINKILYKVYELRATQAVQISPLFISYSHGDGLFVDKLESYLNNKGIRFWRDVHDMTSGRIETQIDRAIRQNPTVLLILSEHSMKSDWVEHEVRTARELEKEMGRDTLCPVALDDSWKNSHWPKRVMEQIMEYNILDFSTWKDDSKFGSTFNKLIDGLELFYKA